MDHKIRIRKTAVLAGILTFLSAAAAARGPAAFASAPHTPAAAQHAASEAADSARSDYRRGYEAGYRAGYRDALRRGNHSPEGADNTPGGRTDSPESRSDPSPGRNSTIRRNSATGRNTGRISATDRYARVSSSRTDAPARERRFMHRLGADFRPEYIFPTNPFVKGENLAGMPVDLSLSGHLRYSFQYTPGSVPDRIYGGAYQGLGFAYYDFGNPAELGNPLAVYLFQGARIARLSRSLSFNYEWNLGLSFGWEPYDREHNTFNVMTGSKMNAYINADFYLNWMVTREVDFSAGVSLTHFSNGNTKFPNAGLNAIGLRAGITYNFGRKSAEMAPRTLCPAFPRHMSYDLTLFGSWRRKGIEVGDKQYAAPDAYTVVGFNFASMYNFGYKFRAGVSVDGVYDGSANVYMADNIVQMGGSDQLIVEKPGIDKQLALGFSARAEFVMPYFNIGVGLGVNALHKGGDLKAFYQMLTLKVALTRSSYVHIGYCLRDFHMPNFLMLGLGYRFNNKYPRHR